MNDMFIRPVTADDERFLQQALYVALWDPPETLRRPQSVMQEPRIARLVGDWGRAGDIGFVAEHRDGEIPVGAVWIRTYKPPPIGEDLVDHGVPHLGIAVLQEHQGQGIGTALMRRALAVAHKVYPGVALSVHPQNPARRWYHRLGFSEVGAAQGDYIVMLLEFEDSRSSTYIAHLFEFSEHLDRVGTLDSRRVLGRQRRPHP